MQGIPVKSIEVGPKALSPTFFAERIESIDNATSSAMFAALTVEGCFNSTGFLVENPRQVFRTLSLQLSILSRFPSTSKIFENFTFH